MSSSTQPISVGCVFFLQKVTTASALPRVATLGCLFGLGAEARSEASRVESGRWWSAGFDHLEVSISTIFMFMGTFFGGAQGCTMKTRWQFHAHEEKKTKSLTCRKFPAKKMRVILHVYMMVWFLGSSAIDSFFGARCPWKVLLRENA